MPIKLLLKQEFFDHCYLRNDPHQFPYSLVAVAAYPGHTVLIVRDAQGEVCEFYEGEVSFERDEALRLSYPDEE